MISSPRGLADRTSGNGNPFAALASRGFIVSMSSFDRDQVSLQGGRSLLRSRSKELNMLGCPGKERVGLVRVLIGKQFRFEAGHRLDGLPEGHKCGREHGHSYLVELSVTAPTLTSTGFVVDFGELAPFRRYIDDGLDHRFLNDVIPVPPTAENIASHLAAWFTANLEDSLGARLVAVKVWETATSWAEIRVDA
ncbi:6-pyruvoyl tetrahydropterin synthase family protein [Streptomyces sp. NPDC057521]|uniref:6-pyruvoyl trahydropterin synthase family protein n=1 Tax=Streptomyces sp. NPDC057521 TaxID=3346156 RepID=UPI0036C23A13